MTIHPVSTSPEPAFYAFLEKRRYKMDAIIFFTAMALFAGGLVIILDLGEKWAKHRQKKAQKKKIELFRQAYNL